MSPTRTALAAATIAWAAAAGPAPATAQSPLSDVFHAEPAPEPADWRDAFAARPEPSGPRPGWSRSTERRPPDPWLRQVRNAARSRGGAAADSRAAAGGDSLSAADVAPWAADASPADRTRLEGILAALIGDDAAAAAGELGGAAFESVGEQMKKLQKAMGLDDGPLFRRSTGGICGRRT